MVMVQLKEGVVPSCTGGAEGWSRLMVSEFVFSCPCLQEAFPDFLALHPGPPSILLVVLELHSGQEFGTPNSKIISAGRYLMLNRGLACWETEA